MSGLGERGQRLRAVARQLAPAPQIPPFYVEAPDEIEIRATGWYFRRTRTGPPVFLGHSATAAEVWLRLQLDEQRKRADGPADGKRRARAAKRK